MGYFRLSRNAEGQTIVALLVFVLMAITLTTAAVTVMAVTTRTNTGFINGEQARLNAETGVENALEMLERNPSYAGETMTLSNGTATITVSGTTTKTIVSAGVSGALHRTITATATQSGTTWTLNTWSETP